MPLIPNNLPLGKRDSDHDKASFTLPGDILEAWAEGYMVGSLVILMLIVICNYRRHVYLHKLIIGEMMLAVLHGTFIFLDDPKFGWYLSATATLLFISYQVHNFIAYLKIRPFLPRWGRLTFVISLLCVQPYWIVEAYTNFEYFNTDNNLNVYTRPWEALARDPWWIFTTCFLFYKIKAQYEFTALSLISTSMRFVVMMFCMVLSIAFLLADVIVTAANISTDAGINPYWRLTLVFKCASDTIFLDDFKSVLESIVAKRFRKFRIGDAPPGRRNAMGGSDSYGNRPISPTTREPKQGSGNFTTVSVGHEKHGKGARKSDQRWKNHIWRSDSVTIAEHVELVDHDLHSPTRKSRSGDANSDDAILPKPIPVFSSQTLSYDR